MIAQCGCFDDGYEGIKYCLLHEAAPIMLEALQEVEWVKVYHQGDFYLECPSCDEPKQAEHNDDCKLNAAIKTATKRGKNHED